MLVAMDLILPTQVTQTESRSNGITTCQRLTVLKLSHSAQVVPLFIGDDSTDEDVFQAVEERGIGIRVGKDTYGTAAHYILEDPAEVMEFLENLAANAALDTI
jgi:trehalose-phosphatase